MDCRNIFQGLKTSMKLHSKQHEHLCLSEPLCHNGSFCIVLNGALLGEAQPDRIAQLANSIQCERFTLFDTAFHWSPAHCSRKICRAKPLALFIDQLIKFIILESKYKSVNQTIIISISTIMKNTFEEYGLAPLKYPISQMPLLPQTITPLTKQ